MKSKEFVKDPCLIIEVLNTIICEKYDAIWYNPFKEEVNDQILDDIFTKDPICIN